jgi:2-polyprenyl-3-methyl-5-hydroxy-6-metoxy-1,4-benzoquinol methylase
MSDKGQATAYFQRTRPEMLGVIPGDAKTLLEIGCAEGYFGGRLKEQRPMEIWGVELLPEVAEKARTRLDRVLVGKIEDHIPSIPDGYFDCIVLNDVLEHLIDPWTVLRDLRRKLTSKGALVASIPNVRHFPNLVNLLVRRDWEYTEWGILDRTHLRFFTSKSIERLFDGCGYELVSMQGIEESPPSWKFVVLNRLLLNALSDCRFLVFACVARPRTVL